MAERVLMEEMSWTEIQQAIKAGKTTVILNTGAVEQHGPHLPTGTDSYHGEAVAVEVARRLGDALVAPVIRVAFSEHHSDFPGTLTLSFGTFLRVLEEHCLCLARHGFRHIVLVSSHGGNNDAMLAYLPFIAKRLKGRCQVHMIVPDWSRYFEPTQPIWEKHQVRKGEAGAHGGYSETSRMLAVRPQLVRMERAEDGRSDEAFYAPEQIKQSQLESFVMGVKHQSPNGILGDPRRASAEAGREILEVRIGGLVEEIRHLTGSPPSAARSPQA